MTCERERIDGSERRGGRPRRIGLRNCAEDHADQAQDRLRVAGDRTGRLRGEHRRVGNHEGDRAQAAGIGRDLGEDMLQRDVAGRDRRRIGDVDRPLAGRGGARKIETRRVARDRQVERDQERLVRDAVVVEMVLERIGPIRQAADAGAHQRLGAVGQRREGAGDGIVAVFVEERAKPALAEIERVELTVEVAPVRGRHARVRRQDIDDILVHAPAGDELHRREQRSFLEALGRLRIIPAGHVAADVEPMSGGGEPAEQRARRGRSAARAGNR